MQNLNDTPSQTIVQFSPVLSQTYLTLIKFIVKNINIYNISNWFH